jgi:hypothetical protein
MGKAMGALAFLFALGAGSSTLFGSVLGTYGESAAVTFMGFGMLAVGQLIGTKLHTPSTANDPINQT